MFCPFPNKTKGTACPKCGWMLPIDFEFIPKRNCPVLMGRPVVPQFGFGDLAAMALRSVGVTQQRYANTVTWLVRHWRPDYVHRCLCCQRIAWLNNHTPLWLARLMAAIYLRFRKPNQWTTAKAT